MEASFFFIENRQPGGWDNELPPHHERRGTFWALVSPLLGIRQRFDGDDVDHVSPAIRQLREYEMRRQPPRPTLGDLAGDVVEHVAEAVKEKIKAIDRAKAWLREQLSAGEVAATDIERRAKTARIAFRTLRRAREATGVLARKHGGGWWWSLSEGGQQI